MDTKLRLTKIAQKLYPNISQFEKACYLSNGFVNSIRNSIGPKALIKILEQNPNINKIWLLHGEGSMFLNNESLSSENVGEQKEYPEIVANELKSIKISINESTMKEGEKLRLKIRGSGNTVEQAAELVGLARKTLYNYFKQDVLEDSIKDLFSEKLKLEFAQIDVIQVQNEHTETFEFKNKGKKNIANENFAHEKNDSISIINILAESNKLLTESNRLLIEANQRLTNTEVVATEDELLGIPLRMMPRFVTLLKLVAKAGATGWKTEVEALAEISNTFYADLYSKKAEGIVRH